jgi:hypothetical protein
MNNLRTICQKVNSGEKTSKENKAKKQRNIIDNILGVQYINLLTLFFIFQSGHPINIYHITCDRKGIMRKLEKPAIIGTHKLPKLLGISNVQIIVANYKKGTYKQKHHNKN